VEGTKLLSFPLCQKQRQALDRRRQAAPIGRRSFHKQSDAIEPVLLLSLSQPMTTTTATRKTTGPLSVLRRIYLVSLQERRDPEVYTTFSIEPPTSKPKRESKWGSQTVLAMDDAASRPVIRWVVDLDASTSSNCSQISSRLILLTSLFQSAEARGYSGLVGDENDHETPTKTNKAAAVLFRQAAKILAVICSSQTRHHWTRSELFPFAILSNSNIIVY
jgi:hypothetical protein